MTKIINLHDDLPTELFADRFYGVGNFKKRQDFIDETFDTTIGAIYLPTRFKNVPNFQQRAFEYARLYFSDDKKKLLSFEGLDSFENAKLAEKYVERVDFLSLTWARENNFAYGVGEQGESGDKGLKIEGKKIAEIMRNKCRHIDVSHLNDSGIKELIEMKCPIFASHSNSREVLDVKRNLTPCEIKAISDFGGVIGINGYKGFIGKNATFKKLSRHIKSLVYLGGEDVVSLGLDICGDLLGDNSDCDLLKTKESIENFALFLSSEGFSQTFIDKLFFKNAKRFLKTEGIT